MNTTEHVQFVNVCRCTHPDCHGNEHGCKTGGIGLTEEQLRQMMCKGTPRWERWPHDRFVETFERCPPGCRLVFNRCPPRRGTRKPWERPAEGEESLHLCHARGCGTPVPPRLLMCLRHWKMVPIDIQRRVWHYYRPGQERDKRPSAEYLKVMKEAIEAVAQKEGL
jgi:hypothetical protein